MTRPTAVLGTAALAAACLAAAAPEVLTYKLRGTPDATATGGEARTLDAEGIYCWWDGPGLKPGYFEVVARARTAGAAGVLQFVLCQSGKDTPPLYPVSRTQRGEVTAQEYEDIYCGTFYWDGSYTPRVSDWSSGGLLVDWVQLVPVPLAGIRDPDPGKVKRVLAPHFAESPTIDGNLSEWTRVPALALGPDMARGSRYGGSSDLSALCQWAWDDRALYFAAQVQDDRASVLPDPKDLGSIWQYDCIQMAFDGAQDARTPGYDDDDYEYGFGQTAGVARAYRWVTGNHLVLGDVPTISVAVQRDEERAITSYEVRIPWTELLPFSPATRSCGMTIVVDDNDGEAAQEIWLEWTPGITGPKDPSAFGMLTLIDEAPAASEIITWLAGESDQSDREQSRFVLNVNSPRPLGLVTVEWALTAGGQARASGQVEADLAAAADQVPLDVDLSQVGQGRFALGVSLHQGEETVATAETTFARYAVAELEQRLASIKARQELLWRRVEDWRAQGGQGWYPRATLGVVFEFARNAGDDLDKRNCERAEAVMGDLQAMLDEAEAELDALQTGGLTDWPIPPMVRKRLTVRDGGFWEGDQPVFLIGFCGWWQVWTEYGRFADYGMNHAEDSIVGPFALLPEPDGDPPRGMLEANEWAWERGDERDFRYSRMIACNQLPASFAEKYPQAMGGGWSGVSTLHPAVREFERRYLGIITRAAAKYVSPGVQVLYGENSHSLSRHPLEVAAFRKWLQERYGDIAALNAAWGSAYESFEAVGNGEEATGPVAWHDRGIFNQMLFSDWSAWLVRTAKEGDPQALCTGYPSLLSWDDSSDFSAGIDMEALCRVFDVNGFDTAALDYGGKQWAMNSITGFAMPQELLRAFNPDHPNYDPELHMVNLKQPYPPEYIRAAMWQGFLHGLSASSLWVYQRSEGIDSMLTFQPRVMAEYLRTGLDLRRLVEPVRAFQRAPEEVAILYSLTSIAYNAQHLPELRSAYEGTFFLDADVGFVTERTVLEGGLAGRKLLIVPAASHTPAAVAAAIRRWVETGETLWLVGDCLTHDEPNGTLAALTALQSARLEGEAIERANLGRGLVVRSADRRDTAVYCRLGEAMFAKAGVARPLRVTNTEGKAVGGVEFRMAPYQGSVLVYALNMNKTAMTVTLAGAEGGLTDLRTGARRAWPLTLEPLEVAFGVLDKP